ncbi:hypothetical protein H4582DRAFT_921126 [Lactarius indigo]|nr:hypothetical protein H4582DRAFT_921126 [Lactarius indigo]
MIPATFSQLKLKMESISALKEAIKDQNKSAFRHVDACTLELWSVSIAVDDRFKEKINDWKLMSTKPLSFVERLSTVFSDQLKGEHLHVVVRPPNL